MRVILVVILCISAVETYLFFPAFGDVATTTKISVFWEKLIFAFLNLELKQKVIVEHSLGVRWYYLAFWGAYYCIKKISNCPF